MKRYVRILLLAGWLVPGTAAMAQSIELVTLSNINRTIPDGNASGLSIRTNLASTLVGISSLKIKLEVAGEFNGDLYAYLRQVNSRGTNLCVLLNRVGRTASNPAGYDDAGFKITFDSAANSQDVHLYRLYSIPAAGAPLTGAWQPDGRNIDPFSVNETSARNTSLTNFYGFDAEGEWTLFIADLESGGTNLLANLELEIAGKRKPTLTWTNPADIIYGTPLGALQLNATAGIPGNYAYTPTNGARLAAGDTQKLTVVFTPTDLTRYVAATGQVSINVLKKALSIAANSTNKAYGAPLPAFTATFNGFVNGETASNLTAQPILSTSASSNSPAGTYDIVVSGAAASNYNLTHINGTLTVIPASTVGTLTSSSPLAQIGQNVIFTYQLRAVAPGFGIPTGLVQFKTNNVAAGNPINLAGGIATYTTGTLPAGIHGVAAEYGGDDNFLGSTNVLTGGQTINRPPIALNDNLNKSLTNGTKVQISVLLDNDSDADGDTLVLTSVSATSTNGGSVSTNGGWIYYQPASQSTTNLDAFSYSISDQRGGSSTAWVVINPSVDTAPSPNLTISNPFIGVYVIRFDGIPGLTYRIQSATNITLPVWTTLGSSIADSYGRFLFTNVPPVGETNRFYRSLYP